LTRIFTASSTLISASGPASSFFTATVLMRRRAPWGARKIAWTPRLVRLTSASPATRITLPLRASACS